jgi:hypothetical protein
MSRWAERFAALSGTHDTVDSVDTVAASPDPRLRPPHSVHSVAKCHGAEGATPFGEKAAETVGSRAPGVQSVNSVNSVNSVTVRGREKRGKPPQPGEVSKTLHDFVDCSGESTPSPAHDTVDFVDTTARDERSAIAESDGNALRRWAETYAAICTMPAPDKFTPERWQRIIDAAGDFLDRWANQAAECGWSDLDVFGAHPTRPEARFDCKGLILSLDRCEIVGIDESGADLVTVNGARQRFLRRPLPPGTVLLSRMVQRPGDAA